jgi:hypothetical protein
MHILAIIFLIIVAIITTLAILYVVMSWIYSKELKKLKDDGFYD